MLNIDEAKRAVEVLHDQPFLGRNLIVNGSKARKDSDPKSNNFVADQDAPEDNSDNQTTTASNTNDAAATE